jgi:hypothetical protein
MDEGAKTVCPIDPKQVAACIEAAIELGENGVTVNVEWATEGIMAVFHNSMDECTKRTPPTPDRIGKDAVREALDGLESEARRFAGFYKPNSDMANTLNIFGNKIAEARATPAQEGEVSRG